MLKGLFNKQKEKQKQKGLSLIEASMVLVLSAVVVAGVMVYYQTAQRNNNLDKLSAQMMHIVSEVNGLYAGTTKVGGVTDYNGLSSQSLLASIADLQEYKDSSMVAIKTPDPDYVIFASGELGAYGLALGEVKQGTVSKSFCTKLLSLNFGGQVDYYGYITPNTKNGPQGRVYPDRPFSERLDICNKIVKNTHVGVWFK